MVLNSFHPEIADLERMRAIILVRMMAPKASGNAVLGRHHPPVVPLTGTGIIRSTIGYTILAVLSFARIPLSVMATQDISVAIKVAGWGEEVNESN